MKKITVFLALATLLSLNLAAQQAYHALRLPTERKVETPGFTSVTSLTPLPIVRHTADKPQSKVWSHAGKHWAVLPDETGTYIWRLDGTTWTKDLLISTSTSTRADCKVVGNVVHILLFRGEATAYLSSVEYVPDSETYQLWPQRTTRAEMALDPEAETATLEVDSKGRMWIAYDGAKEAKVIWSDPPYATWSFPITVAPKINSDDICAVVALPGKIGVLWSDQSTKRFGFKTHTDGASPTAWSADEVPASQSALNIGKGMADDHLNMAVASDGTLYCAVKTSYDVVGYPRLALLVRRPSGTWDNLYQITDTEGTRPVVILNEALGKVKVAYTLGERGGDILYRESPTSGIAFSSPFTLISGSYNYATSVKASYSSEVVILASTSSEAVGVLATDPDPINEGLLGDLYAYPNPFLSQSTINFKIPEGGEYVLTLFNVKGEEIVSLRHTNDEAHEMNAVEVDGSKLTSGLYIVRLQTAKGTRTMKLVLGR